MAKFVFRLQSFLNLKEKMEEQKKLEYGKAVQAVEEEKKKKRDMERQRLQLIDDLRNKIIENITPAKYREYNQYIVFMEEEIVRQQEQIEKAERVAEAKRIELVESIKERKC